MLNLTKFDEPDLMSVPPIALNKTVMTASSIRRRPIDINTLSYDQQKEFFRFDKEFDQTFLQVNAHKIKLSPD